MENEEVNFIGSYLMEYNETIAVAESVTSGLLQAALSSADMASQFFQGGITTYNIGQKSRHLHVEPIHALACNGVSEKVAADMAVGACKLFGSDWAIGVTGYAAPLAERAVTDLFAFYCFAFRGQVVASQRMHSAKAKATAVQRYYVATILHDFADRLASAR